jgi:hypothetical protein
VNEHTTFVNFKSIATKYTLTYFISTYIRNKKEKWGWVMQNTTCKNQWAYNECKGYIEIQTAHWSLRPGFCRSMDETKPSVYTSDNGNRPYSLFKKLVAAVPRRIQKDVKKYVFHFKVSIISCHI